MAKNTTCLKDFSCFSGIFLFHRIFPKKTRIIILYVEPIYLQAETAAYPELRLVILMHGDTLKYGSGLDEALEKLLALAGLQEILQKLMEEQQ